MSALDHILGQLALHDAEQAYSKDDLDEAIVEVAQLRERAAVLERLETWMRENPNDHFVYCATVESGGEVSFGVFYAPFAQRISRGPSLQQAIAAALSAAGEPKQET